MFLISRPVNSRRPFPRWHQHRAMPFRYQNADALLQYLAQRLQVFHAVFQLDLARLAVALLSFRARQAALGSAQYPARAAFVDLLALDTAVEFLQVRALNHCPHRHQYLPALLAPGLTDATIQAIALIHLQYGTV